MRDEWEMRISTASSPSTFEIWLRVASRSFSVSQIASKGLRPRSCTLKSESQCFGFDGGYDMNANLKNKKFSFKRFRKTSLLADIVTSGQWWGETVFQIVRAGVLLSSQRHSLSSLLPKTALKTLLFRFKAMNVTSGKPISGRFCGTEERWIKPTGAQAPWLLLHWPRLEEVPAQETSWWRKGTLCQAYACHLSSKRSWAQEEVVKPCMTGMKKNMPNKNDCQQALPHDACEHMWSA